MARPSLNPEGGESPRLKGVRILNDQARGLDYLAAERGKTVSEVVRDALAYYLASQAEADRLASA